MTQVFEWRDAPAADFAVIGNPVSHSLSPSMHGAAFAALGLDHEYVALRVLPEDVWEALDHLEHLGYRGVNVTVPNKGAVIPWLSEVDSFSKRVDAVNTIDVQGRRGTNTDAPGFLETLRKFEVEPPDRVLILGAGGSARALAAAMDEEGYELSICNRTKERAEALVAELGLSAEVLSDAKVEGFQIILNTTSASLAGEVPAIDWAGVADGTLAYDLAYVEGEQTAFLKEAFANGCRIADGRELLVAQGAMSFEWWLGIDAPREAMWEAVH